MKRYNELKRWIHNRQSFSKKDILHKIKDIDLCHKLDLCKKILRSYLQSILMLSVRFECKNLKRKDKDIVQNLKDLKFGYFSNLKILWDIFDKLDELQYQSIYGIEL